MPTYSGPEALAGANGAGNAFAGRRCNPDSTAPRPLPEVDWSPQQLAALDRIEDWLEQGLRPWFYLAGYAGTGKTTLLRHIAIVAGDAVRFAAYTGKAASVMRRKGCTDASTIDQLIYHHPFEWRCHKPCRKPPCRDLCEHAWQEWLGRRLNPDSAAADAGLIIIDECSMLPEGMWHDLSSFKRPILVVGDPGQLPPVEGAGFFTKHEPDVLLTEIHRQAEGDPIIHLATLARHGRPLPLGRHGDSEVLLQCRGDLTGYDAVICGTNATRRQLNRQIRRQLGFSGPLPMRGEKLVLLRNRHDSGLMNGEVVTVLDTGRVNHGFLTLTVEAEGGTPVEIEAPIALLDQDDSNAAGSQGDPVTWGYALTCHKAQGSQWNDVLVINESSVFRGSARTWLYTAITRAADRVTVTRRAP